jgi:hypothetical protein
MDLDALKSFLIALVDEEFGPRPVELAPRWAGGTMTLKPEGDQQPKDVPIEVFFKKLTGIRESLRVLEQKVNGHERLTTEDKVTLQGYVTKCYGSLTTFNILFKHDKDKFVGSGGKGPEEPKEKLTLAEAKRRLGLREHGE